MFEIKKSIRVVGSLTLFPALLSVTAVAHDQPGAHADNVSSRCYELANDWLDSLDEEQMKLAKYEFNEMAEPERLFSEMEKRRKWHYLNSIPTVYQREEGVALQDMTSEQRILAHKFIQCGLSSQGYFKAANIMIGEKVGWETLPDQGIKDSLKFGAIGGSGAYWLAIFGEPSRTEPWQWQMEGHHLALSFTPVFCHFLGLFDPFGHLFGHIGFDIKAISPNFSPLSLSVEGAVDRFFPGVNGFLPHFSGLILAGGLLHSLQPVVPHFLLGFCPGFHHFFTLF